jgi:UDP-N-acetylmuramyl pentapeptide phosphotransferase/UDP-N-acetylglucosamine-1-phosphate transferase
MFYIKVFSITFITTIVIFLISKKFNFLDLPKKGKLHVEPTPYTGGISFVISIILISTFFLFPEEIRIIINYGMLIALIGFIDDKYFLNPTNKLILKSLIIFFFL